MIPQLPATNLLLWKATDGTHVSVYNDFQALFSTRILEIQILDINPTLIDRTRPSYGSGERRSDVSMVQGMVVRDPETWHQVSSFFVTVYRDYVLPFHGRNEYDDGVEGTRGGIDLMDDITMKESRNMPTPADHAVAVGNQAKGDRNKVGKASSNVS
ncbi:hypothetical protein BKA93DRAFT_475838 [Sparassis latifolia]